MSSGVFPSPRTRTNEPVFPRVTLSVLWTVITGASFADRAVDAGSGPPSGIRRLGDWRKRKGKRRHYGYDYVCFDFSSYLLSSFVLAFGELSSLRTHFRPFTEVMRKSRREVTRGLCEQSWIARISRMSQTTFAESLLLNRDEYLGLTVLLMLTYWLKRSRIRALHSQAASLNSSDGPRLPCFTENSFPAVQ